MKSRLLVAAVGIPLLLVILFACPPIVTAVAISLLSAIGAREFKTTTGINTQEGIAAHLELFCKPGSHWRLRCCDSGACAVCTGTFGLPQGEI